MQKYEENDYEKTSHVMKNNSISLGDLQGEKFIVDKKNEDFLGK